MVLSIPLLYGRLWVLKAGDSVTWLITAVEAVSMTTVDLPMYHLWDQECSRIFLSKASVQDHTSAICYSPELV